MYTVRLWSVRHAGALERVYALFERTLVFAAPLLRRIGWQRLEKPVAFVERNVKGFFFDCQMCGRCVLSSTGMSCPMNCPKNLRNGPCGGVRENGHCEVKPEMRCVWVQGWNGSRAMEEGNRILDVQSPVDFSLKGTSAWLRVAREKSGEEAPKVAHA